MVNILNFLRTWCCLPSARPRPSSPIARASHYNARLRANLGMEAAYPAPAPDQSTSPRFPHSTIPWSTANMTRAELRELFNLIHATLEHVPYAICGLAALIDHGFAGRKANRVSIVCPQESKDNIKAWAAARGHEIYTDSVGIPTRDGAVRRVRIKYLDAGFDRLQRVRSSLSHATVLSLLSELDSIAAGYLVYRRAGDERRLSTVAGDVFFVLGLMAARHENVDSRLLPTFLGEEFFADFTARYAEARPEMARAGIHVSAVLSKHRAAAALREHDELLQRYGAKGDVIPPQRGQFEDLRRDRGGDGRGGPGRSLTAGRAPRNPKPA